MKELEISKTIQKCPIISIREKKIFLDLKNACILSFTHLVRFCGYKFEGKLLEIEESKRNKPCLKLLKRPTEGDRH